MTRFAPTKLRAAAVTAVLLAATPVVGQPGFGAWLATLRREAERRGISSATLDAALTGLSPIPRVLELDRRQPEFTLTLREYLSRYVSAARIERGRAHLAEHRALLEEINVRYGVPPRVIVALWGLETEYGQTTGDFPVIGALATLAHDGRRSGFFREQLFAALRIVDQGHVPVARMRGSWAGAMGQNQFLPSSFLHYAVDHDGDGRRDIWTSRPDIFASIANYLARAGWRPRETWGHAVRVPAGLDGAAGSAARRPLPEWQRLGVRRSDGGDLPAGDTPGSLLLPAPRDGSAYLVFENFRVLLRWNRSDLFAVAAGLLADALGGADGSGDVATP